MSAIGRFTSNRHHADASIWLFQFLKVMRDDQGEFIPNGHLLGFFRRICSLLFNKIRPVFVFDGATPFLKRLTVAARRQRRETQYAQV
jgi:DNA excision repair protein ERCC-5